jgi:hypothetical protein
MPQVFVISKSCHDYSPAAKFGSLCYLSTGRMDKLNVNEMVRQFTEVMQDSTEEDFILPTSLSIMSGIAMSLFALKHGCLNLLLFKNDRYIERKINFRNLE